MNEINYAKEALTHNYNMYIVAGFIVVMFLTGTFWAWLMVFLAVQVLVWMSSFTSYVRRFLYIETATMTQSEMLRIEDGIYDNLSGNHKAELSNIRSLCEKIKNRLRTSDTDQTIGIMDRLVEFRYRFAKLLEVHYSMSQDKEFKSTKKGLVEAIRETESALQRESNQKIRSTLQTNINILNQRLKKIESADSKIRELDVHLNLVKNSLELLYDDIRTSTNLDETLTMVDGLVASVTVDEDISAVKLEDLRLPHSMTKEVVYEERSKYVS